VDYVINKIMLYVGLLFYRLACGLSVAVRNVDLFKTYIGHKFGITSWRRSPFGLFERRWK